MAPIIARARGEGRPPADAADADQSQLGLSRAFASAMPQPHAEGPVGDYDGRRLIPGRR
jgi:hypothetical protein